MKKVFGILGLLLIAMALCTGTALATEQVFYYITDPAGTPLVMTDDKDNVVWTADFKPFGEEHAVSGTVENRKRFVGKEKDEETGLSNFGARYFDARTGRFIAVDPVRVVDPMTSKTNEKLLLNPQRLNAYAYALNNPYRYVDPDGREPLLNDVMSRVVSSETFIRFGEAIGASQLNAALTGYDFRGNEFSGTEKIGQLGVALIMASTSPLSKSSVPSAVESNFARFLKKVPANSKSSATIENLENGAYRFTATSPGEVPGSKAIYEKFVDANGKTTGYFKTTLDPKGQLVHKKDKIGP